jgi:3-oxoacyl-[acyl-carrier protein] reductase
MHNVIVTGGSKGIGLAIARRLSATGRCVIAIARRNSDALVSAIESTPGNLHFHSFDLHETSAIPNLVKTIREEHGPIYGLVNNAGLGTGGLLSVMKNSDIEATIRVNTLSPVILTKYAVRAMMSDGEGRIVNISSVVAETGYKGLAVYSATKGALVAFTRSLARELGPLNINVNAIAPGFVDSDMTASLGAEQRNQIVRRSALRRLAEPEDIARAAEFLMSDAGRNITGTVLTVDAGSTA